MSGTEVLRWAAFTDDPAGGNPAGVVIGEAWPEVSEMQSVATDVGYSETAFLAGDGGINWRVRYFSPQAEVPFCGHATIASAVALSERFGLDEFRLETAVGAIPVTIDRAGERARAVLTSVEPHIEDLPAELRTELLQCFGWTDADLDPRLPIEVADAGARHPVIALRTREALSGMRYDFDQLRGLMLHHDWTTVQVIWRESDSTFWARNPFPVGGVVEDPATGAAAAALGGYLRAHGLVPLPARLTIHQGDDLGRPSLISVFVGRQGGIQVSGSAVVMLDGEANTAAQPPAGQTADPRRVRRPAAVHRPRPG